MRFSHLLMGLLGTVKMIRGAGMPSYRHHDPGKMFINFEVEFPTETPHLDSAQKDMLKSILGLPVLDPEHKAAIRASKQQNNPNGMQVDEDDELEVDPLQVPLPENVDEDEVDLEDVDHSSARRAQGATMEDDDEDGIPHGAERVQCASQ